MKRMSNGTDQAKCGRITRRALAALLTLCVLFACMAGTAMAEDCAHNFSNNVCQSCGVTGGDCSAIGYKVWYTLTENDSVLTIGGSGMMNAYHNGLWGGNPPWHDCVGSIEKVVIESGVTRIAGFKGMNKLTSVTIPETVTEISRNAFKDCAALTTLSIPRAGIIILDNAFDGAGLTTVNVPCDWNNETNNGKFGDGVTVNRNIHKGVASYVPTEDGGQHVVTYTCCNTPITEDHAPDENGYTVNDGTHSFTCACGEPITEPHAYKNGVCACGLVATYTLSMMSAGVEIESVIIDDNAVLLTPGEAIRVQHGKELTVKLKNVVSKTETDVFCEGRTVIGENVVQCEYNKDTNTLIIPGSEVKGNIGISAAPYVRIQFNLNGGEVTDAGKAHFNEVGCIWDQESSAMKGRYGYSVYLSGAFERSGHEFAGAEKNGSEKITNELQIWRDMTVDVLWECTTLNSVEAVPATCTTKGSIAHYACACDKLYAEDKTTELTAEQIETPVDPDAHSINAETGECARCGKFVAVAKVDDDYFAVFANAVAAWEVESAKAMTLLADVTYGDVIRLQSGGARTLDLNGHTLTKTVRSTSALEHFVPLTVNDSSANGTGKFIADSVWFSVIHSGSTTLTVNGGTFTTSNGSYALNLNYANAEVDSDNVKLEAVAPINVSGASDSNSLTITGSGCDGWKICNNCWNAVPISIPYGFHLEDEEGKQLAANNSLPAGAYTFIKADHVHAWSYAADDAADVITAACANADGHCPDTQQSLTLDASGAVYSGNPVEAEVIRDGKDLTYTLRYTGNGYDSVDAPTDAGDYTVTMTVGDKSVSDTFTISPKNIANCAVALDKTTYEYSGGVPAFVIRAEDNGVGSYAMQMDTDYTVSASGTDVGEYKLTVTGTGNYTGSVELNYTITPAAAPEILFPAAGGITYGQTLASSALTGGSTALGSFAWLDASIAPPAGSGSYTVAFTPGDTRNYNYAQTEGWNAQTGTVQRAVEIAVAKAVGQARVTLESWAYGAQPNAPVPESATHGTENVTYLYKAKDAPESAYSAEIPTQIGEYTVRANFAGTDNYLPISAEADFAVTMSQTAFEGGLGVYNGDTPATTFTYGDTITVRVKPVATGEAVLGKRLRMAVPANHMALFLGDTQLCEAAAADADGVYEMTIDTAEKALQIGTSSITAQYVSDGYKADYSQNVTVILNKKELRAADVSAEHRIFKSGNTKVNVTEVTLSGVVGSDLVYTQAQTADTGSDQVGTYHTVTLPETLEPMGADAQWYTISGGAGVPANGGAGVRILDVPGDLELRVRINEDYSDEDVRETDLGRIPQLDTVAEIDAALRVRVQEKGAVSHDAVLYDVVLEYLDADGVTWVRADKEHFPEGGIDVVLPVIEGTTPETHTYTVAHMFTMNMRGHAAGDVEYPQASAVQNEKGEWMLEFTVSGLSPVMIAATPIQAALPATGDSSSLALWAALACLSLAALAFTAKRRAL